MGGQVRIRRASNASSKSHQTSGTWSVTSGSNTGAAEKRRQQRKSGLTQEPSPHTKDTSLKGPTVAKRQRSGVLGTGCPLGRASVVVPSSDESVDSDSKMEESSQATVKRSLCSSEVTQNGRDDHVDFFDRNMILSELANLRAENSSLLASKLEASTLQLENSRLKEENEVLKQEYERLMENIVGLKEENETLISRNESLREENEGCRGLLVDALKSVRELEDEAEAAAQKLERVTVAASERVTERAEKMRDALMGLTQVTCEQEDRISTLWLKLDSTRRQVAEKDMRIERLLKDLNKSPSRRGLKRIPETTQEDDDEDDSNHHQREMDQLRLDVAKKLLLLEDGGDDAISTTEAEKTEQGQSSPRRLHVSDQELERRVKEQFQGIMSTMNDEDEDGTTDVLRNELQEKIERIVLLELDLEMTREALQSVRDNELSSSSEGGFSSSST